MNFSVRRNSIFSGFPSAATELSWFLSSYSKKKDFPIGFTGFLPGFYQLLPILDTALDFIIRATKKVRHVAWLFIQVPTATPGVVDPAIKSQSADQWEVDSIEND